MRGMCWQKDPSDPFPSGFDTRAKIKNSFSMFLQVVLPTLRTLRSSSHFASQRNPEWECPRWVDPELDKFFRGRVIERAKKMDSSQSVMLESRLLMSGTHASLLGPRAQSDHRIHSSQPELLVDPDEIGFSMGRRRPGEDADIRMQLLVSTILEEERAESRPEAL